VDFSYFFFFFSIIVQLPDDTEINRNLGRLLMSIRFCVRQTQCCNAWSYVLGVYDGMFSLSKTFVKNACLNKRYIPSQAIAGRVLRACSMLRGKKKISAVYSIGNKCAIHDELYTRIWNLIVLLYRSLLQWVYAWAKWSRRIVLVTSADGDVSVPRGKYRW
jgi:hypothetical protein